MTRGGDVEPDPDAQCTCKVGRTARKYDMAGLDMDLRRRRDADDSLRDLERFVNEAILERAIRQADVEVIGSVESVLDTLTQEGASSGERTEVRSRLAAAGVDTEKLESDFISYQTVRTHLRECLGVDTGDRGEFSVEDARGTIQWSRTRNAAVIEQTLDRLRRRGALQIGPVEVTGLIRVTCSTCGATYSVDDLLARGGCECDGKG